MKRKERRDRKRKTFVNSEGQELSAVSNSLFVHARSHTPIWMEGTRGALSLTANGRLPAHFLAQNLMFGEKDLLVLQSFRLSFDFCFNVFIVR